MLNSRAYTEVYYITNKMSEKLRKKIPEEILKNIENRMDKSYEFYIENDNFENIELLEDTEKILSVLYTDYLATDEERKIILNKEKILTNKKNLPEIKIQEVFSEEIDKDNFKEKNSLIKRKKKKWRYIFEFFKNLFK